MLLIFISFLFSCFFAEGGAIFVCCTSCVFMLDSVV